MPFQLKNICCLLLTSLLHHKEYKVFKDAVIPVLVSWSKCRFSNRISPHSKMITLGMMRFQSHDHITQAFTIAKLTKYQCKKLIPAREWLDISITIVFSTKWRNLSLSRNSTNWTKTYLFCSYTIYLIDYKVENSNRHTIKKLL